LLLKNFHNAAISIKKKKGNVSSLTDSSKYKCVSNIQKDFFLSHIIVSVDFS